MPSPDLSSDNMNKSPGSRPTILTENTDDFIIGDRIWVNGTKPGYIQYLGDTHFGAGEWAGVVLDDHSGKNDGSVSGIRYFQCEPKRGVFSRLHKLTRFPITGGGISPDPGRTSSPMGSNGGRSGSSSPLLRCSTPTRTPSPGLASRVPKIGDRIVVSTTSGLKTGVLRYQGSTDFAAGEWAGIELDEPTGKNDGTVAGKRYFNCIYKHGLFAPIYKVSKATGSAASMRKYHDGSHESLSSSLSSRMSGEPQEVKSEKAEGDRHSSSRYGQKSSPDKQVQIQLDQLQKEHRGYVEESEKRTNRLRQLLDGAEAERKSLRAQLQEEKRKVEDLQFRVDEECINKDDLQAQTVKEKNIIEELETKLKDEIKKNELLSQGQTLDTATVEMMNKSREEIQILKEKLRKADAEIENLKKEKERRRSPMRSHEEELTRKEEQLLQMQVTLDNKKRELQSLHSRINELEKETENYKNRHQKHLDTIDNLNVKLRRMDATNAATNDQLHSSKKNLEETERRLATIEEKCAELEKEKATIREQVDEALVNDQISSSLNNQLKIKEKQIAELERQISRQEQGERSLREGQQTAIRSLISEHKEVLAGTRSKIERLEQELKRETEKSSKYVDDLNRERERKSHAGSVELDFTKERLEEARDQLKRKQAETDRLRTEKDEARRRLEFAEERCKRSEEEREAHVSMLKSEVNRLKSEFTTHREDLVKKLAETQYDTQLAHDLQCQIESQRRLLEEVQSRLKDSQEQRDRLHSELINTKSAILEQRQEAESRGALLRQELASLKKRENELVGDLDASRRHVEATQILADQRQQQVDSHQSEIHRLRSVVSELQDERDRIPRQMENKMAELQMELTKLTNTRHSFDSENQLMRTEKEALENQVEFLQSVIIDMQKKNDELRNQIDILETEVIFDGPIKSAISRDRVQTRFACDVCHSFDEHETLDCPKLKRSALTKLSDTKMF